MQTLAEAQTFFTQHRAQVDDYLRERGITPETAERFGLGFAPDAWDDLTQHLFQTGYKASDAEAAGLVRTSDNGRTYDYFRNRLTIPIRDKYGRVIAFGGRTMGDDDAKYINSPETDTFKKADTIFALDLAADAIRESRTAVIVEGYMDAIQAHQQGYTNVVACMGTAVTPAVFQKMVSLGAKRVVLALDADTAGEQATERSIEALVESCGCEVGRRNRGNTLHVLRIPSGKDPDDFLRETPMEWDRLVREAPSAGRWLTGRLIQSLPATCGVIEAERVVGRCAPFMGHNDAALIGAKLCGPIHSSLPLDMRQGWTRLAMDIRERKLRQSRCTCVASNEGVTAWGEYLRNKMVEIARWYAGRDPEQSKKAAGLLGRINRALGDQVMIADWLQLAQACDAMQERYQDDLLHWHNPAAWEREHLALFGAHIKVMADKLDDAQLEALALAYIIDWCKVHLRLTFVRRGDTWEAWSNGRLLITAPNQWQALEQAFGKLNTDENVIDQAEVFNV